MSKRMSGGGGLLRSGGGSLHFPDDDDKYDYLFKVGINDGGVMQYAGREVAEGGWGEREKLFSGLSGLGGSAGDMFALRSRCFENVVGWICSFENKLSVF